MREIDITSEREITEAVRDSVESAALAAITNLEVMGLARFGDGITKPARRVAFETEAAEGAGSVRDAARDLVDMLATVGEEWGREHTGCDTFARESGEAWQVLAAKLARITDEIERGWLYGDNLVRTLAALTEAVSAQADSVTTEREASPDDMREVTVYLSVVPAELAGMVSA